MKKEIEFQASLANEYYGKLQQLEHNTQKKGIETDRQILNLQSDLDLVLSENMELRKRERDAQEIIVSLQNQMALIQANNKESIYLSQVGSINEDLRKERAYNKELLGEIDIMG